MSYAENGHDATKHNTAEKSSTAPCLKGKSVNYPSFGNWSYTLPLSPNAKSDPAEIRRGQMWILPKYVKCFEITRFNHFQTLSGRFTHDTGLNHQLENYVIGKSLFRIHLKNGQKLVLKLGSVTRFEVKT